MRKLFLVIICSFLVTCGVITYAQTDQTAALQDSDVEPQDSTIDVIGFFSKNDTLIYWINESKWELDTSDTIKTAGISSKVRLTVVDSTSTGYKMDYTILEVSSDTNVNSFINGLQEKFVDKLAPKMVGFTINFETDEFGAITKFNNLDEIKHQAQSLFKETMKEVMQIFKSDEIKDEIKKEPEITKGPEINIDALIKAFDTDRIIDGYTKNLELIFLWYGCSFDIGQLHVHENATDSTYENDTFTTVTLDPTDYTYSISTEVINIIPRSAIKEMVSSLVDLTGNGKVKESFDSEFDAQVTEDAINNSYIGSEFIPLGWPYKILKQESSTIGGRGKSSQTYIYLDYTN